MKKKATLNGRNEIGRSIEHSLDEYFRKLDGEPASGIYDMVIGHVERTVLASVLTRAGGNQTQAADMLGLNRNTLRAKLAKYKIVA
ncbi:MAG TPA: helix-turn-helix domain-containing protein [Casimicrobiaceae bacterium]